MKFSRGSLGLPLPSTVSPIGTGHQAPGSSPDSNHLLASDCSLEGSSPGNWRLLVAAGQFPEGSPTLGLQQPLLLLENKILNLDGNLGSKAQCPPESEERRNYGGLGIWEVFVPLRVLLFTFTPSPWEHIDSLTVGRASLFIKGQAGNTLGFTGCTQFLLHILPSLLILTLINILHSFLSCRPQELATVRPVPRTQFPDCSVDPIDQLAETPHLLWLLHATSSCNMKVS